MPSRRARSRSSISFLLLISNSLDTLLSILQKHGRDARATLLRFKQADAPRNLAVATIGFVVFVDAGKEELNVERVDLHALVIGSAKDFAARYLLDPLRVLFDVQPAGEGAFFADGQVIPSPIGKIGPECFAKSPSRFLGLDDREIFAVSPEP